MLVTAEVSQLEMSPYVTLEVAASLSHEATAVLMLLVVIAVLQLVAEEAEKVPTAHTSVEAERPEVAQNDPAGQASQDVDPVEA